MERVAKKSAEKAKFTRILQGGSEIRKNLSPPSEETIRTFDFTSGSDVVGNDQVVAEVH